MKDLIQEVKDLVRRTNLDPDLILRRTRENLRPESPAGGASMKYDPVVRIFLKIPQSRDPQNFVLKILKSRGYSEEALALDRWADDGGRVSENPIPTFAFRTV